METKKAVDGVGQYIVNILKGTFDSFRRALASLPLHEFQIGLNL